MGDTLGGSYNAVKPLLREKAAERPITTTVANCGKASWGPKLASHFLTSCIAGTSSGMSMRITVPSLSRLWMSS
jgi:hypothetical protein